MVQKAVSRGRPRSFDAEAVLGSVRDTFWKHGYSGTSMDQLVAATGLHKPSLYGAFGDKRRLYLAALEAYLETVREELGAALRIPSLVDSLAAFTGGAIRLFTQGGPRGCFMLSTAVPEACDDPEVTRIVREAMDGLDEALVRRFRKAIREGELAEDADAEALAMIVVANHYDLSARARAGYSPAELAELAARTLGLVRRLGGIDARPSTAAG